MKKIGFIGLGNMGGAMAQNLVKAGFEVRGYDPAPAARERAGAAGVAVADDPAGAAAGAAVICSSVPATEHALDIYLGDAGALAGAPWGATCFDFSTISVAGSMRIAAEAEKRGIIFLDAPVSGSIDYAEKGELAIMVGGEKTALDAHADVLRAVGSSVDHFGPNGAGLHMKLVINHIMSIHTCAFSEGLALGKKAGLDPDQMARTIRNSVLGYMHVYKPRSIVEKNYAPTFSVDYMLKDMRLISEVAESARSPIPLGALCRQMYTGAAAAGFGGKGTSAVSEVFERGAGISP